VPFSVKQVGDEHLLVEGNDIGVTEVTPSSEVMNAVAEATGVVVASAS
jgi:hypothetical protein